MLIIVHVLMALCAHGLGIHYTSNNAIIGTEMEGIFKCESFGTTCVRMRLDIDNREKLC